MNKQVLLKLLVCAILCASAVRDGSSQTNAPAPNAAPPGSGAGRGGARGFFGRGQQVTEPASAGSAGGRHTAADR